MHDEQIPCHNHEHGHFPDEIPRNHPCHHIYDCAADCCDDQLPIEAKIGRGPRGEGFFVRILDPDDCTQTYLEGLSIDPSTGEVHSEWVSDNINGGELSYQYNLRPFTIPQTFTITFIYRRPSGKEAMTGWKRTPPDEKDRFTDMSNYGNNDGKKPTHPREECIGSSPEWGKELGRPDNCSWSWTTPAIPYVWDVDGDGNPDADHMVGSGVATLFVRTDNYDHQEQVGDRGDIPDAKWNERLVYPPGTTRDDYFAPLPLEAWSANITFGLLHGDVLVPNLYDLAKSLGWSANNIYNSVDGKSQQYCSGVSRTCYDDIHKYIDGNDQWLLDHFHDDLGFPEETRPGEFDPGDETGGDKPEAYTVKGYLDWWLNFILNRISSPGQAIQLEFDDGQAEDLFTHHPRQNNWSEQKLGGTFLIYPTLGFMVISFVYRTAVNNGTLDDQGANGQVLHDTTKLNRGENESIVNLNLLASKLAEVTDEYTIEDFLPKDEQSYHHIGHTTITGGGGQALLSSSSGVASCDLMFKPDGNICVNSELEFSPRIWPLLHLVPQVFSTYEDCDKVVEWDVTIQATIFVALNDKWNDERPWEKKYKGYSDPFAHPSKPPEEMFGTDWDIKRGA